jgi:hypothetical protein
MWLLVSVSVLVSVLVLVLVLGSALGMGLDLILALVSVSSSALICAAFQAAAGGAVPAPPVHLSGSDMGVSRPPGRHPRCPLSSPLSGSVL